MSTPVSAQALAHCCKRQLLLSLSSSFKPFSNPFAQLHKNDLSIGLQTSLFKFLDYADIKFSYIEIVDILTEQVYHIAVGNPPVRFRVNKPWESPRLPFLVIR